jgi:glucose/arabinose dehydrogenase
VTEPARKPLKASAVINASIIALGLIGIAILLVGQFIGGEAAEPEPLDLDLSFETVATGFESPVLLLAGGDDPTERLVVEQRGLVRRLAADGSIEPEPFLDIRDRVLHHHERGLLGLAFHPDYAENGRLFALYSRAADDGATSISEFTVTADGPTEDTERTLLVIPSASTLHKGGMLGFDAEGMLVAGIGDGSTGNDPDGAGQDRASLLATLLRLDVDRGFPYGAPPDNGFADDREARAEIHAIGLRNPWRFSVDDETGHIYIGDVGQGGWEEINVLAPDTREPSFGWSVMEGADCFYGRDCDPSQHIEPVIAYPHADGEVGHCSVVGGYVYRGQASTLPAGTYLYADHCSGTVWAVPAEQLRAGNASPTVVGKVPAESGQVQSFGRDGAGELYLLTNSGNVLEIDAADPR